MILRKASAVPGGLAAPASTDQHRLSKKQNGAGFCPRRSAFGYSVQGTAKRLFDFDRFRIRIARSRLLVEGQLHLVVGIDVHRDAATAHQLAEQQFISQRTTEHHRQNVMRKMGTRSLAGLVRMVGSVTRDSSTRA